jgi:hypothetical protein
MVIMWDEASEIGKAWGIGFVAVRIALAELMPGKRTDAKALLRQADEGANAFVRVSTGGGSTRPVDTTDALEMAAISGDVKLTSGDSGWAVMLTPSGAASVEEFCRRWGYDPIWLRTEASPPSPFVLSPDSARQS